MCGFWVGEVGGGVWWGVGSVLGRKEQDGVLEEEDLGVTQK